eukprot:g3150.t1
MLYLSPASSTSGEAFVRGKHAPSAHGVPTALFFHLPHFDQVLEGQQRASIQTQGIADDLTETGVKLSGLSDSLSQELVSAMKEIEKQVLEGQQRASIQTQGIADDLTETGVKLSGLSDSLSQELVSAMKEIEKQESLLASLMANQAVAAAQASSFSTELGSAKSELASYMQAIEEDRRVAKEQNLDLMQTIDFIHDCLDNASSAWARFQAFT